MQSSIPVKYLQNRNMILTLPKISGQSRINARSKLDNHPGAYLKKYSCFLEFPIVILVKISKETIWKLNAWGSPLLHNRPFIKSDRNIWPFPYLLRRSVYSWNVIILIISSVTSHVLSNCEWCNYLSLKLLWLYPPEISGDITFFCLLRSPCHLFFTIHLPKLLL